MEPNPRLQDRSRSRDAGPMLTSKFGVAEPQGSPKISDQSKRYGRPVSHLHRFFFSLNPSLERYSKLVLKGHAYRPHYAYAMLSAALLARQLGYASISAIEFGVKDGSGLMDMEYHAMDIQNHVGVRFEIYGFAESANTSRPADYRDAPYLWRAGQYETDLDSLSKTLRHSKLVLGPLKDTTGTFFDAYKPAPVGVVFEDLYQYTATLDTFNVFAKESRRYLPRVFLYFDNTLETSEHAGELLAIRKYNEANAHRKIDILSLKAEEMSSHWQKWNYLGKKFYYWHDFLHDRYSEFIP
jgi:hypothetical protein